MEKWTIPSPPPEYNFKEIPQVHSLDAFWHKKYAEDREGKPVAIPAGASDPHEGDDDGHGIHLPSPSFMPLLASLGFPILGLGMVYSGSETEVYGWLGGGQLSTFMRPLIPIGIAIITVGIYGWALEPATEEDPGHA